MRLMVENDAFHRIPAHWEIDGMSEGKRAVRQRCQVRIGNLVGRILADHVNHLSAGVLHQGEKRDVHAMLLQLRQWGSTHTGGGQFHRDGALQPVGAGPEPQGRGPEVECMRLRLGVQRIQRSYFKWERN